MATLPATTSKEPIGDNEDHIIDMSHEKLLIPNRSELDEIDINDNDQSGNEVTQPPDEATQPPDSNDKITNEVTDEHMEMSIPEVTITPGGEPPKDKAKIPYKNLSKLHKFRYVFQYPYFRMFVAYFVTICNFLIYAEDPVAHSYSKCDIPVIGNTFSMVFTKYPRHGFSVLKVLMWLTAIVVGLVIGKLLIHSMLLDKKFKLGMFSKDQGSWMICFLTTILTILISSAIYNAFLSLNSSMAKYKITGYIGATNHIFMRAAAMGTWFGDFVTAWMVTDMMLQEEKKYTHWAATVRKWWNKGRRRVVLFWVFTVVLTIIVITAICSHFINWDKFNRDQVYTNEVGRAFLASFILVMDVTIVMQDWDFPLFDSSFDIKLPGLNVAEIKFNLPDWLKNYKIHITGKWFQYGVLFIVMLLDLNMWKNQIFYSPLAYGQYTGDDDHIFSVKDKFSLSHYNNATVFSYDWRKVNINPATNKTFMDADYRTNSRYRGYSMFAKGLAFIPSLSIFVVFATLIILFGRRAGSVDLNNVPNSETDGKKRVDTKIGENTGVVTLTNLKKIDSRGKTKKVRDTDDIKEDEKTSAVVT